ncbi:MAG TPA: MATE family efflux transporter [Paracoccaceae bacterium]|nr:MATE family efflux transporter [Paracoccaceae bacterium]
MTLTTPNAAAVQGAAPTGWGGHVRATLKLGAPLVAAQLAHQSISLTDTVMLGWLGAEPLAAGVLGWTLFFIGFIIGSGFAHAVMPLAAAAEGEGDVRGVRRAVRMGLWVVGLAVALMMVPLLFAESLLLLMGQEPALAEMAGGYVRILQWALFPAVAVMVMRSYLSALERASIVMWAMLGGAVLNAVLNWMLIFGNWGAPALGIEGAAWATLGTNLLILAVLAFYARFTAALRKYEIFVRFLRPDWGAFFEVLRLGLPIGATLLAEIALFAASAMMMGWLGTVPLAAHGIAIQIISAIFMIPLGLSSAGTVRVGRALGRRDAEGIRRAAVTVHGLALGVAICGAAVLWLSPGPLVRLFLDEANPEAEAIMATGATLLAVAAVFQIVDTLQVVSAGLLRGLRDTRLPMMMAIVSYWLVGMPTAYVLGFVLDLGGVGVWSGLAVGLACAAVLLTLRFFRRPEVVNGL